MQAILTIMRLNICMVLVFFPSMTQFALTQELTKSGQAKVVVKNLQGRFYPPLANFARIGGTADVGIIVRQDGSIESAWVVQAPAMLTQAALDIAKLAFPLLDCQMCRARGADYVMHLTFEPGKSLGNCANSTNGIVNAQWQSQHSKDEVSITPDDKIVIRGMWTCLFVDYASHWARAPKCLYLWKCKLVPYEPVFKNIEDPDLPHQQEVDKSKS